MPYMAGITMTMMFVSGTLGAAPSASPSPSEYSYSYYPSYGQRVPYESPSPSPSPLPLMPLCGPPGRQAGASHYIVVGGHLEAPWPSI